MDCRETSEETETWVVGGGPCPLSRGGMKVRRRRVKMDWGPAKPFRWTLLSSSP